MAQKARIEKKIGDKKFDELLEIVLNQDKELFDRLGR